MYADLSISRKIYLPNFIIIVLLIGISSFVANQVVSDLMIRRISDSTRQSLDIIIQSLNNVLNDIEVGASKVASDPVIQNILLKTNSAEYAEGLDSYFLSRSILDKILYLKNFIDSISVYKLDGELLGSGYINMPRSGERKQLNNSLIRTIAEAKGRNIWLDQGALAYSAENRAYSGVTMLRAVLKGNLGDVVGVLEVNLNEVIFSKLYSHLDYGKTGRFIVVNRQGMMVFPETKDNGLYSEFLRKRYYDWIKDTNAEGKISTFGKEKFIVISNYLERLGWIIIGLVPLKELMDYSQWLTVSIYIIGVVCIFLEILFALMISQSISKPIVALSQSMADAAQGDLQIRVDENRRDEIGTLSRSFNEMIERISQLMDQVYFDQKRQRELELIALQSQINPHFLYNSLESLCALSQLGRNEDSYRLGKALSLFYRGVLSSGRLVVRVEEEVRTLEHYLAIQEIRYKDKFACWLGIDDDVMAGKIIKLSLQPLVENSIYHGLKNVRRKGKIWIRGRREPDDLIRITVMDNGIGIEADKVADVLERREEGGKQGGFGLSSVDQRIKLFFGNEYGLSVESRFGYWTKVHILLPADWE